MAGVGNEIRIVNQLHKVFKILGEFASIGLPQIAWLALSSGKSSVLEAIVSWDFLPRGSGIVTRCPLVLQLIHVDALSENVASNGDSGATADYIKLEDQPSRPNFVGMFDHKEGSIFTSPDAIRREIEERTNVIAGKDKNVSHERIVLELSSPDFIDLTLVDLPGLMKNPVGDQPVDIEEQTEELIMTYIRSENSLILAVTPMNADMVNSDSIKLVRKVDPEFKRTLAVLTKLDIMDSGTNARKEMTGQVLPFKLGIIAVTNRTQQEIENNKSIKEHLETERKFFEANYKDLSREHRVPYLAKKLNTLLLEHIRGRIPGLRQKLDEMKGALSDKLRGMGEQVVNKSVMVHQILKKFSDDYRDAVKGSLRDLEDKKRGGGTRINEIFHADFTKALMTVPPLGNLVLKDVKMAIEKCGGLHPNLFVPEKAFRDLAEERNKSFTNSAVECAKDVHHEMEDIMDRSTSEVQRLLDRFPDIRGEIFEVVRKLLETRHDMAQQFVEELVQISPVIN